MLTIALASFALGAWPTQPYLVEDEMDARGNSFTGMYNPLTSEFEDNVYLVLASGAVFEGGLEANRFNGYGVIHDSHVTASGKTIEWRFEGTFEEGRLMGEGSYSNHLGTYTGNFVNSLPNGQGIYRSINGWSYEGEFLAGKMTGTGTVTLSDGRSATGVFKDGIQVSAQ